VGGVLLGAAALAAITAEDARIVFDAVPLFEQFQKDYQKSYVTAEEKEYRFGVFVANLERANAINRMEGKETHGVTQFMDLTPAEFKRFLGFAPRTYNQLPAVQAPSLSAVSCSSATDCNYADLGAVTPVKDQGQCGSCWAFSTTEAVETSWFQAGNKLPVLAPQQIVDCDKTDAGCNGGDTPTAYEYVIKAGGMETEAEYPYKARDGTCAFKSADVVASIKSYSWGITPCNTVATHNCDSQNETGLWSVVQNIGPQSICVDAEPWQTYRSGIYSGSACKHGYYDLDHCVHLTGYGVEAGQKYWLVKNSWGTSWGEKGYIRLAYGQNICGVADEVTYAKS
jgi:C1A family cysteine protease